MKKKNVVILVIVILLVLALGAAALIFFSPKEEPVEETKTEENAPAETKGEEEETKTEAGEQVNREPEKDEADEDEEIVKVPDDLPSTVVIPTVKDPTPEVESGVVFPCQVPNYGLTLEKLAPYSGLYVEDGRNLPLENVAMLQVKNNSDKPVEFMRLAVNLGGETLTFEVSALPSGERAVVQEKSGKRYDGSVPLEALATVVNRAEMEMSTDKVSVVDNGDNTLTVTNITDKSIPNLRVFYKYYMENEDIFVGGIAFQLRMIRLLPGESVTVQPAHYTSASCRVVMVQTYDK